MRLQRVLGLVVLGVIMVLIVLSNISPSLYSEDALVNFGSLYATGVKMVNGENPYGPDSEYIFENVFPKVAVAGKMMNLNPPVSLLCFRPLAEASPLLDELSIVDVNSLSPI